MATIQKEEMYIYECEKCGRKSLYGFLEHATAKNRMDYCKGKVRRIKWKNAWG